MKNIKLIAIASVLAASSLVAVAHADSMNSTASMKPYAGIEGGYESMDIQNGTYGNQSIGSITQTKPHGYFNIHGGLLVPMNQTWSLGGQVGYTYYGQIKESATFLNQNVASSSIAMQSFNFQGVAQANFNSFFVRGLAGIGSFYLSANGASSSTRIAPTAALEAGYDITSNFDVYAAYHHVFGTNYKVATNSNSGNGVPTIDQFGVGVDYIF